ncbi:MAG TPA: PKD domain-containing protein [Agriterribacter sp.]|nr:PKD domain-containing protein [Agriterribacter sp.]
MKKRIFYTIFVFFLTQAVTAQTPVANFSANVMEGCAPLRVNFKDESTGDPKYWDWEFTDGGTFSQLANQQNPGITFSQPGTYSVTLVVRNANGANAVTKTNYITVYPSPNVSLSADLTTACLPASIQFTGTASTSVGTISDWAWDFGDGTTSTQQNPNHTYADPGYYNVALTVTSSNGCSRRTSRARYIRMVSGIVADFVNAPAVMCKPPFGIAFTNESSGPGRLTYSWNFGDGNTSDSTNPTAGYAADGNYTVQLIAQSNFGCKDTVQKAVSVTSFTAGFNSADSTCLVDPVQFTNTSVAGYSSLLWNFGDGTQSSDPNPVKTFAAPGDYTVKLISTYANCSDSVSKTIKITPRAPVDFTATNNIGCGTPLIVQFQNSTAGAISWFWDFGDGQTSTLQNPTHTYTNVTSYDVKLTVTTANGCGNTIAKPRFVRVIPTTVRITTSVDSGCVNSTTVNPSAMVRTVEAIASYSWNFGDGNTSTNANPTHTYTAAGVFPMTVTVTTIGGCTVTSAPHYVRVGTPPSGADFKVFTAANCVSDSVYFTVTATGGANEWIWDFGDGEVSSEQNPVHVYRDTGSFTVQLLPMNNGCAGTPVPKANLFRKDAPVANFGYTVNCSNPLLVKFSDSSIVDSGLGPISYQWQFGDGQTFAGQNPPDHVYSASGEYNVTLTVTNGSCTAIYIRRISLFSVNADFTLPSGAFCKNTQLLFQSVEDSSKVTAYTWLVDGLAVRNEFSFDSVFQTPGDRVLELSVVDLNGCSASVSKTISVKSPVAQFATAAAVHCGTGAVSFNDQSTSGTPISEWYWDFGDNNTQTFTAPPFTHQYADTGTYTIKLMVKDADGCVDDFTMGNKLSVSTPKAYFGTAKTLYCPGLPLAFKDSSSGSALAYSWNFGDGNNAVIQQPSHIYAAGVYTVSLKVTDSLGCSDSLVRTDYIDVRTPVAAFDARDTSSTCQLLEAKFFNKSQNYESFYWDFGDSTNSTLQEPKHFYDVYGKYVVKLFVTGYGGCVDSAVGQVNVYNPFDSANTKIAYSVPTSVCNQITVPFQITTPPGTSFQFAFGDGKMDSSGQKNLSHLYDYPNSYRPAVLLVDSQDCRVTVSGPVVINVKGAVPVFNIDKKQFCDSGTVFLTNYTITNDPPVSHAWDFGDGLTSTDRTPPAHTYPQAGLFPVSLTATTQSGCVRTFTDTVRVYRTPSPVISADNITCINRALAFNGALAQPPDTAIIWNWNFGDGRTTTDRNNTISYSTPGNYNVSLVAANNFGCKDTAMHQISVAPLPVINVQNAVIPVGGQIVMPVSYSSGIVQYTWNPADGLSCANCAVPIARPKFSTTYQVQVTDSNTCVSTADVTIDVVCREENYFVPNTFSPNGDGMNDVFYPRGRGLASVQSMKIYNRWGQLVFERRSFSANDASLGWNGKLNGQSLPPDVYVYMVEFVCENAQIVTMKGDITLIR